MNLFWALVFSDFILSLAILAVHGYRITEFSLMTSPKYGALGIGDAWNSTSLVICVVTCQRLYTSCNSVAYNTVSQSCTPGSIIQYGVPPLSSNQGDSFFYGDYCDNGAGFRLFLKDNLIECLFISKEPVLYSIARSVCADKKARPMTASTELRFQLFLSVVQNVVRQDTWIGLVKDKKGVWMWENGEKYDEGRMRQMFRVGQPDNHGGIQNCVSSRFNNVNNLLDDSTCDITRYFVCEALF